MYMCIYMLFFSQYTGMDLGYFFILLFFRDDTMTSRNRTLAVSLDSGSVVTFCAPDFSSSEGCVPFD